MNERRKYFIGALLLISLSLVVIGSFHIFPNNDQKAALSPTEQEAVKALRGFLLTSDSKSSDRTICFLADDLAGFLKKYLPVSERSNLKFMQPLAEKTKDCLEKSDWVLLPEPWIPKKETSPADISAIQNARTLVFRKQDLGAKWERTGVSFNFPPSLQLHILSQTKPQQ